MSNPALDDVRAAGAAFGAARVAEVIAGIETAKGSNGLVYEDEAQALHKEAVRQIVQEELRLERDGYKGKAIKHWRRAALNTYRVGLTRAEEAELQAERAGRGD